MQKRATYILLAIFLFLGVTGMAQRPSHEVPVPDRNFVVSVTDDQGITTRCTLVTWDSALYLLGTRGKGIVTIPFEKVSKAVFAGERAKDRIDFQITLKNAEVVAVSLDAESLLQGTTDFGSYRIKARNIKEIRFE